MKHLCLFCGTKVPKKSTQGLLTLIKRSTISFELLFAQKLHKRSVGIYNVDA